MNNEKNRYGDVELEEFQTIITQKLEEAKEDLEIFKIKINLMSY